MDQLENEKATCQLCQPVACVRCYHEFFSVGFNSTTFEKNWPIFEQSNEPVITRRGFQPVLCARKREIVSGAFSFHLMG